MPYVVPLNLLDQEDYQLVGTKGANLGELKRAGLPIPSGFVVTNEAYQEIISQTDIEEKIGKILNDILPTKPEQIIEASQKIEKLFDTLTLSKKLANEISQASKFLSRGKRGNLAVRSSAISEDIKGLSFAGEYASFLDVSYQKLLEKIKSCWTSQFSPRAISYAAEHKVNLRKNPLSVIVQDFVEAQVAGAGFTQNPLSGDKNEIIIEAIWGLGLLANYGMVIPDRYLVRKNTWRIIAKIYGSQKTQLIRQGDVAKEVPISQAFQARQKLSDAKIIELAKLAKIIENHFYFPQNFEWALSKGKLVILQSRPVSPYDQIKGSKVAFQMPILLSGTGASKGYGWGQVRVIKKMSDLKNVKRGDVLITASTNPDFILGMKKASAIVTDRGGITSHAAILARELGKPCVVGAGEATHILRNGEIVTVEGTSGKIFFGQPPLSSKTLLFKKQAKIKKSNGQGNGPRTAQKIYCYLASLDERIGVIDQDIDGLYIDTITARSTRNFSSLENILKGKKVILATNKNEEVLLKNYDQGSFEVALSNIRSKREISAAGKRADTVFLIFDLPFHLIAHKDFLEEKIEGIILDIDGLIKNSLGETSEDELWLSKYATDSHFVNELENLIGEAKRRRLKIFFLFKNQFYWELLSLAVKKGVWGLIVPPLLIPALREILHQLEEEVVKEDIAKSQGRIDPWQKL